MELHTNILWNYYFKGARDYVQGPVIFDSFCTVLRDNRFDRFFVKDLKFHKKLHNNGQIILSIPTQEIDFLEQQLVASMNFSCQGQPSKILLIDPGSSAVSERKDDTTAMSIKEVVLLSDFTAHAKMVNIDNFERLITVLVEVNKRTHQKTLKDFNNEYIYQITLLSDLEVDFFQDLSGEIPVEVKHVGLKRVDDGTSFTLNKLFFSLKNTSACITVGFTLKKK